MRACEAFLEVGSLEFCREMTIHTAGGVIFTPTISPLLLHIFVVEPSQSFKLIELIDFAFLLLYILLFQVSYSLFLLRILKFQPRIYPINPVHISYLSCT